MAVNEMCKIDNIFSVIQNRLVLLASKISYFYDFIAKYYSSKRAQ